MKIVKVVLLQQTTSSQIDVVRRTIDVDILVKFMQLLVLDWLQIQIILHTYLSL